MKRITLLFFVLVAFMACKNRTYDDSLLLGKWKGATWTVAGQAEGRVAGAVRFEFLDDKTYEGSFGQESEKGTYYLSGKQLYTTAEGKAKKMVEISKLSSDTLTFQMNRMGTLETLVLIKQ